MDVVCGRCRAEYEFDDALISERGTTVRCTNCGLQFKVFPPVGQRAPEMWLVFDPKDQRVEPVRYDSLRDMQKAIARGDVTAEHLLARGDEQPRRLKNILELQPLLQQPRSEPPPPPEADVEAAQPPAQPGTRTVLGIQQRPDPAVLASRDELESHDDGEDSSSDELAVVPGEGSEPRIPALGVAEGESKPRIRSALSMSPTTPTLAQPLAAEVELESSDSRQSIPPPRHSLRSTLSSTPPSSRPTPDSSRLGGAEPSSASSSRVSPPPAEAKPDLEPPPKKSAPATRGVTQPVDPVISDSGEFARQMTPTPTGMRAYGAPDAPPASSLPGVHVKQGARTGGIVLAVLLGGAGFLLFANRDRLSGAVPAPRPAAEQSIEAPVEISAELALRIQLADAAWQAATLLKNAETKFSAPSSERLQNLEEELKQAGADQSWERVNLFRMQGRLQEARTLAGALEKGPEQSYSLALLDLAEETDDPPWPVVIERLKEAAAGEREHFLARSAYIYALAASGAVSRARADFEALGRLAGARQAPLFEELGVYLEGQNPSEDEVEGGAVDGEEDVKAIDTDAVDDEPTSDQRDEPAQEETTATERPKPPKVSDAIKSQVTQADAMWRGGNQEGALAIYRKVVAEVGTDHFLGQRSAARIAQAEREKAAKP